MPLAGRPPFGMYPTNRLDPVLVDSLGQQQGYRVSWEKALPCPRRLLKDGSKHDFNCPVCANSHGLIYFDLLTTYTDALGRAAVELRMVVTSIPLHTQNMDGGVVLPGSALISMPVGVKVGYKDRITLLDSKIRVSEIVKRGGGTTDKLKYPGIPTSADATAGLVRAQAGNPVSTIYTIPDQVTINAQGEVQWVPGEGPAVGQYYAAMYWRRPAYIVMDILHVVRDSLKPEHGSRGTEINYDFGGQIVGQLDFMVRDESA